MRNGIYKVTLDAAGVKGLIIGALCDGEITGCDQTHFATGSYQRQGNRVRGSFHLTRHSHRAAFQEIANLDNITAHFDGICSDSFGEFDSKVEGRPGLTVKASFRWISEL